MMFDHVLPLQPPDLDWQVVTLFPQHRLFQFAEPGAYRQPQFFQTVFHEINMTFLLQGKGKTGDPMVKEQGADPECLLVKKHAGGKRHRPDISRNEPFLAVELRHQSLAVGVHLDGNNGKIGRVISDQIPGIAAQPVPHLVDKTGRTIEMDFLLAAETDPYQLVEADEMVDVGMGDKHVAYPQKLAVREITEISQIEQESSARKEKIDV
jgi:hypothetical protein